MFHWLSCLFTVVYPVYNQSLSIQIFCHAVKPNYSALQLKTNSSCKKKNVQFRLPYFVIKNRHDATFLSLQQKSSIVDFNCSSYLLVVNAPGSCPHTPLLTGTTLSSKLQHPRPWWCCCSVSFTSIRGAVVIWSANIALKKTTNPLARCSSLTQTVNYHRTL